MKIIINENQLLKLEAMILSEEDNIAFKKTENLSPNLQKIWDVIERKKEMLQKEIFGELGDKLYDIVKEKAKVMGDEMLQIPNNIVSAGNSKLPGNVLIINMSSALMCPSYYLGTCTIKNGLCYAQKDENRYNERKKNEKDSAQTKNWKTDLMHTQMLQQYKNGNKTPFKEYFRLIETYIQLGNAYAKNILKKEIEKNEFVKKAKLTKEEIEVLRRATNEYRITDVRLNESGDFHCQLSVDLWAKFARKIKKKYGINTHAYTARYLDFTKASKDIAINASHNGIETAENTERLYKVVSEEFYDSLKGGDKTLYGEPILGVHNGINFYKCPCDKNTTCDYCRVCFNKNNTGMPYTIYVRPHGLVAANGLKSLFTTKEINKTMQQLINNGWASQKEIEIYKSNNNKKRLKDLSDKIEKQRKNAEKQELKKAEKKELANSEKKPTKRNKK